MAKGHDLPKAVANLLLCLGWEHGRMSISKQSCPFCFRGSLLPHYWTVSSVRLMKSNLRTRPPPSSESLSLYPPQGFLRQLIAGVLSNCSLKCYLSLGDWAALGGNAGTASKSRGRNFVIEEPSQWSAAYRARCLAQCWELFVGLQTDWGGAKMISNWEDKAINW